MNPGQFLEVAVSLAIQTAIIVIATAGMCRLVSRRSHLQSRLWAMTHGALLVLIMLAAAFPHLRNRPRWSLTAAQIVDIANLQVILGHSVLTIWLIGATISVAFTVIGWWRTICCLKQCVPVELQTIEGLASDLISEFRQRKITLLVGPHIAGPCCWQFHQPYVVLPVALLSFEPAKLTFILRHELAHLILGHPLQLFLQRIVESMLWFHPFVWWGSAQAGLTREFACDDAVIGTPDDVVAYLKTILAVLEQTTAAASPSRETLAFGAGAGIVAKRAKHLLSLSQGNWMADTRSMSPHCRTTNVALVAIAIGVTCVWAPVDVLQSSRSHWSPWPTWSAAVLSNLGVAVRDYEMYDPEAQLFELRHQAGESR
jgi:bla regulator protein blaR1